MKNKPFEVLIQQERLEKRIAQMASILDRDYAHQQEVVFVIVLKGAICLAVDLMRTMQTPVVIECIRASSYGQRGIQRGSLVLEGIEALDLTGRSVLIIDDIYDSGQTIQAIVSALQAKKPASLKSLVLLQKQRDQETPLYQPDYVLFPIKDHFVIGWGLDYKEHYRNLMDICAFEERS